MNTRATIKTIRSYEQESIPSPLGFFTVYSRGASATRDQVSYRLESKNREYQQVLQKKEGTTIYTDNGKSVVLAGIPYPDLYQGQFKFTRHGCHQDHKKTFFFFKVRLLRPLQMYRGTSTKEKFHAVEKNFFLNSKRSTL